MFSTHDLGTGPYPWFALDLGQSHLVTGLTIHPRTGGAAARTNGIDVRVGDVRPPKVVKYDSTLVFV